ncbi:MAG TPA: hypothetical protein DIT64_21495 [Verrucomicrobiales bacterium]|nr:hypothetical protein [Verrucomicrobiales bacterium]
MGQDATVRGKGKCDFRFSPAASTSRVTDAEGMPHSPDHPTMQGRYQIISKIAEGGGWGLWDGPFTAD